MSAKPTYETQRIDHLGIVAGICQEISLIEQIDAHEPEREAISVTYGYSKDHSPDLKQVVMHLITHHKSALPVWLEVLSGNSHDKKTFKATIKAYCKQLNAEEQAYVVMDSAGFSEDTLKEAQDICWIFQLFEGLDILLVKQNGQVMLRQLLNLRPAQQQVIILLGPQVQKCYPFGS